MVDGFTPAVANIKLNGRDVDVAGSNRPPSQRSMHVAAAISREKKTVDDLAKSAGISNEDYVGLAEKCGLSRAVGGSEELNSLRCMRNLLRDMVSDEAGE